MLPSTYDWALRFPVDPLTASIRRSRLPLLAIGSGGSFTTAHLAAAFHARQFGLPALPSTPLEAARGDLDLREIAVLLLTAGGKNPDILGAFDQLVRREPRRLSVVCATTGSKLADAAHRYPTVELCEFDLPAGRDGFLATNSLLASGVILARAYATVGRQDLTLPAKFGALCDSTFGEIDYSRLLARPTLLVLHPPALKTVAVEIESKFIEAALGNVQIADFRQFAHGRHHWLAKRGEESAVLALSIGSDPVDDTLELLPKSVPSVVLNLPHDGPMACLAGIVHAFDLVRQAGETRDIDPGDPGVPSFGRELYNLNVFTRERPARSGSLADPEVAIARKTRTTASTPSEIWLGAHATFLDRLAKACVAAIVADYDGTLCDEVRRAEPLPGEVAEELTRLLRLGLHLGVATGRGQSVRKQLQEAIPKEFWGRVIVGYYNGSDIGLLSEDDRPDGTEAVLEPLKPVAELLLRLQPFLGIDAPELRRNQITLKSGALPVEQLWQRVQGLVAPHLFPGVTVLRSGHSVDVLAPGVSKLAVVKRIGDIAGCEETEVLCIGDQGGWPGNDHALLGTPLSLSSNIVSADPERCWNLAAAGVRESRATLGYLRLLKRSQGAVRFGFSPPPRKRT
ncbi:MAG: sucrose-6-phosphate hydrolase [Planctomycetes bacterium]|nr:sucrose-6-phosphate hydrolase [Planctomycetota bacterium]